jgi:hypothetical protein
MNRIARRITVLAIAVGAALPMSACAAAPSSTAKPQEQAKVEAVGDTGLKKLTLTDKAVQRLGITTAPVGAAGAQLQMPYSALLYLPDGTTFAYTNPEGTSYVRAAVGVQAIQGDQVVLVSGPPAGTAVVTTGGAELWGAEFGIK